MRQAKFRTHFISTAEQTHIRSTCNKISPTLDFDCSSQFRHIRSTHSTLIRTNEFYSMPIRVIPFLAMLPILYTYRYICRCLKVEFDITISFFFFFSSVLSILFHFVQLFSFQSSSFPVIICFYTFAHSFFFSFRSICRMPMQSQSKSKKSKEKKKRFTQNIKCANISVVVVIVCSTHRKLWCRRLLCCAPLHPCVGTQMLNKYIRLVPRLLTKDLSYYIEFSVSNYYYRTATTHKVYTDDVRRGTFITLQQKIWYNQKENNDFCVIVNHQLSKARIRYLTMRKNKRNFVKQRKKKKK